MIASAIASAYSSCTKWPPSKESNSADGKACFTAAGAAGEKERDHSPPEDKRLRLPALQKGGPFRGALNFVESFINNLEIKARYDAIEKA